MHSLPDDAISGPLSVTDLRSLGVTDAERRGGLWQPVRRGVLAWHALDTTDPDTRIRAAVVDRPGAVLGGWASLRVQGAVALDGRCGPAAGDLQPVVLHVGPAGRVRPTAGLDVDRGRLDPEDVLEVDGLLVTGASLACSTTAQRHGLEEGLVVADAAVRAALTSRAALAERARSLAGARGAPAVRQLAELVDGRSRSAPETRLRYVWVVEAGLPRPECNVTLVDLEGNVVAMPDLFLGEAGLVGEYDGAQHRLLAAHTADNVREEAIEQLGLVVARATALDLWPGRRQLVRRLRARHLLGMSRDTGKDRWGLAR